MKKIILTTAIFITVNNFCFSQEELVENKNLKPPSRIAGTVGLLFQESYHFDELFDMGYSIYLTGYHSISNDWFLSIAIGYNSIEEKYISSFPYYIESSLFKKHIPISLGINYFLYKQKLYVGVEIGRVYTKDNNEIFNNWYWRDKMFFCPVIGFSHPLSKHINFETNIKAIGGIGINAGISYSIPQKNR